MGGTYAPAESRASRSAMHEGSPAHASADDDDDDDDDDVVSVFWTIATLETVFEPTSAASTTEGATVMIDAAIDATSVDVTETDHAVGSRLRSSASFQEQWSFPRRACVWKRTCRGDADVGTDVPALPDRRARSVTHGTTPLATHARAQTVAIAPVRA